MEEKKEEPRKNESVVADYEKLEQDSAVVINATELMQKVAVISEETSRYVDENGILHVDVLDAKIKTGMQSKVVARLFPGYKIEAAESSEAYDAYNAMNGNDVFNAIIIYEPVEGDVVLSRIFISQGKFSLETLEKLFA